jgi:hypothetical protein
MKAEGFGRRTIVDQSDLTDLTDLFPSAFSLQTSSLNPLSFPHA